MDEISKNESSEQMDSEMLRDGLPKINYASEMYYYED